MTSHTNTSTYENKSTINQNTEDNNSDTLLNPEGISTNSGNRNEKSRKVKSYSFIRTFWIIPPGIICYLFNEFIAEPLAPDGLNKKDNVTNTDTEKILFEWKNISTSLLHSSVQSILTFICIYYAYQKGKGFNLFSIKNIWTQEIRYATIIFSITVGYFIYDTLDMAVRAREQLTWVIIAHHVISTSIVYFMLIQENYHWFGIIGMLFEVHSVVYHIKNLIEMTEENKSFDNKTYLFFTILNYLFWLIFRIGTNTIIAYKVIKSRRSCENKYVLFFWYFMVFIFYIINFDLLRKIVCGDLETFKV